MSLKIHHPVGDVASGDGKQAYFSPYMDNGGSTVAIAGEDYVIIATDTRLSAGFQILSREQPKLFRLTKSTVLGCSGCWCDILTLTRLIEARIKMYNHEHRKQMSTGAIAQLLTTMLYQRRFFPYYVSNVLVGFDEEGKGITYSYDPVGHCSKSTFVASGSSGALLQPLLDNQVGLKNLEGVQPVPVSKEKALTLIKDTFVSAAERDIYTGDGILVNIISKDGIVEQTIPLRHD
ncbi:unnamed protein product [Darwinula stevensoni]|uniref:Proteasome subunit beta type n=1 Tax=Darwinula stevensoni TaxID=69355 RepID=A0A7R9AAP8_9CRUS|nr:unnamed protein product [Darwinula stevensoni]CAG0898450.1 unnamed protein product [Darwinula stevensoni]